jgi:hypothetical protein
MENFVVELLPVLDVIANSVSVPKAASPGLTIAIEPGFVPTRTRAVPEDGVGKKTVEAVPDVCVPVPVPKLYVHGCALDTNASMINAHINRDLKGFIGLCLVIKEAQSWKEEGCSLLGKCFHSLNSYEH